MTIARCMTILGLGQRDPPRVLHRNLAARAMSPAGGVGGPTRAGPRAPLRLLLADGGAPVWTLFIASPRVREWGFHCPSGWRRWQDFVAPTPGGNTTGRGCE